MSALHAWRHLWTALNLWVYHVWTQWNSNNRFICFHSKKFNKLFIRLIVCFSFKSWNNFRTGGQLASKLIFPAKLATEREKYDLVSIVEDFRQEKWLWLSFFLLFKVNQDRGASRAYFMGYCKTISLFLLLIIYEEEKRSLSNLQIEKQWGLKNINNDLVRK